MKLNIAFILSILRMRKISFGSLADVFILLLTLQSLLAHALQPSCSYLKGTDISTGNESLQEVAESVLTVDCKITREQDNCLSFISLPHEMKVVEEFTYISDNNEERAYVNVTIDSNWGLPNEQTELKDRFLLRENIGTCWNVQVTGGNHPYQVIIFNLPVSPKYELTAAIVLMDHNNQICNTSESKKSCLILDNTNLTFIPVPSKNDSIHLAMVVDEPSVYKVELYSGDCNITCNGDLNNCTVNLTSSGIYTLTAETRKEVRFDKLLPSKHYCARIGLENNECCLIHTETKYMIGASNFPYEMSEEPISLYPVLVIVIIILVISLVTLYLLKIKICRVMKMPKSPMIESGECDTAQILESEIRHLVQLMRDNLQVYLVYLSDNEDFLKLMVSFRRLLSIHVEKVWDPLSPEDSEYVQNNIPLWVENILDNPNVRIILIENENVIRAENMWIAGNLPIQYERLLPHKTFIYTLNSLRRPRERSRLFIVRLKNGCSMKFKSFDSSRYQIPEHLDQLIYDMGRHLVKRPNSNLQDFIRYTNLLVLYSTQREDFIRDLAVFDVKV